MVSTWCSVLFWVGCCVAFVCLDPGLQFVYCGSIRQLGSLSKSGQDQRIKTQGLQVRQAVNVVCSLLLSVLLTSILVLEPTSMLIKYVANPLHGLIVMPVTGLLEQTADSDRACVRVQSSNY